VYTASGEQNIEGSGILSRQGAFPIPPGSDLRRAGVELNDRGYIHINERLETSASEVWASANALPARRSLMCPPMTFRSSKG
jgi:pyruvate/2-oxoglutarate dehydrogenase complex dihydrolipoamide dehydrogenase (E3) component